MLALDPVTHDLYFKDLQLATISEQDTNSVEHVTQRLKTKLLWVQSEWFLNEEYGIPYFTEVFVKTSDVASIDDLFKVAIASEAGIASLLYYSSNFDRVNRSLSIECEVRLTSGQITTISLGL